MQGDGFLSGGILCVLGHQTGITLHSPRNEMPDSMVLLSLQYCIVLSEYMNIRILECMGRMSRSSEKHITVRRRRFYKTEWRMLLRSAKERTTDRTAILHPTTSVPHLGPGS